MIPKPVEVAFAQEGNLVAIEGFMLQQLRSDACDQVPHLGNDAREERDYLVADALLVIKMRLTGGAVA